MIYGDQGPFIHVTIVQGMKASPTRIDNTTNCHHARGRQSGPPTFCHQLTSLSLSRAQILSSSEGRNRPMGVTPQIPGILRASSGVGAFLRLFVLPPCFFTLCLNVKRGLTGRGVHLLVAWLLVLANASGTLTDGRSVLIDRRAAARLPERFTLTVRGLGPLKHLDLELDGEQWGELLYT